MKHNELGWQAIHSVALRLIRVHLQHETRSVRHKKKHSVPLFLHNCLSAAQKIARDKFVNSETEKAPESGVWRENVSEIRKDSSGGKQIWKVNAGCVLRGKYYTRFKLRVLDIFGVIFDSGPRHCGETLLVSA